MDEDLVSTGAEAEVQPDTATEEFATEEVVRYTGAPAVDIRVLTVADFRRAKVEAEDAEEVTWNADNNWTVPRSRLAFLTEDEFDRIITGDGAFVVETAKR